MTLPLRLPKGCRLEKRPFFEALKIIMENFLWQLSSRGGGKVLVATKKIPFFAASLMGTLANVPTYLLN